MLLPFAIAAILVVMFLPPRHGVLVLCFSLPLATFAVLGNVLLSDLLVMALCVAIFVQVLLTRRVMLKTAQGPLVWLALLLLWAGLGAWFMPRIFDHASDVVTLRQVDGRFVIDSFLLEPSGANATQFVRLVLSAGAFAAIATPRLGADPHRVVLRAVAVATIVHITLSGLDWMGHAFGVPWLMSPVRTLPQAILVNQHYPGLRRLIGGFTEPASFGLFTLGLYAFWLRFALAAWQSLWPALCAVVLGGFAVRSTSAAAMGGFAAITILAALGPGGFLHRGFGRGSQRRNAISFGVILFSLAPVLIAGAIVIVQLFPDVRAVLETGLLGKLTSQSATERLGWNAQAIENLKDSFGLGLGIGSARASSWGLSVLANLGLPGALLYGGFLYSVLRHPSGGDRRWNDCTPTIDALRWGCFAILLQSMLTAPFPNLGVPFFVMAGFCVALRQAGQQGSSATGSRARAVPPRRVLP
ncbi:hypothetical protein SAMN04488044_1453 [Cognatishimia maritima]|uniref:O-antigen ligase like membrane protein n=2 Tax=Cognatishimia maritima TaxID=870908 RepID=A0A1M5N8Q7_9RHOB|nr:hypothetical protein SAMN04488044_1453 [Cognatishimia maritima]